MAWEIISHGIENAWCLVQAKYYKRTRSVKRPLRRPSIVVEGSWLWMQSSTIPWCTTQNNNVESPNCRFWRQHEHTITNYSFFFFTLKPFVPRVQVWRSCESTHLPPMWPGFDSGTQRHMWVQFVGSLLCTERVFSGYSGFRLSSKTKNWFDLRLFLDPVASVPNLCSSDRTTRHLKFHSFPFLSFPSKFKTV